MDPQEETAQLELRVTVVTQVLLVLPALQVLLELPALSDPPANRETEERLVLKALLDPPDLLELEEWLDPKDPVVTRVRPERLVREDRRDTEVSPVCRVYLDLPVKLVTRVLLDLLDLMDQEDHLDLLAPLERMVPMVCPDLSDPLDLVVALENLVLLVPPETLDPPALPDPQALASTCLLSPACHRPRRAPILSGT